MCLTTPILLPTNVHSRLLTGSMVLAGGGTQDCMPVFNAPNVSQPVFSIVVMPKVRYYVTPSVSCDFSLLSYEQKCFIVSGFFAEEWVDLLPV